MNTPTRRLEILLPESHAPVSNTEMWLSLSATALVMMLVGLWFVGAF